MSSAKPARCRTRIAFSFPDGCFESEGDVRRSMWPSSFLLSTMQHVFQTYTRLFCVSGGVAVGHVVAGRTLTTICRRRTGPGGCRTAVIG